LVRLNIDVLVTYSNPAVLAAKQATTTIPIVIAISGDAVGSGLIASLNRPGGNVTGQTFFNPELNAKRLEILKEALPQSRRVAVLFNPSNTIARSILQAMALPAVPLKLDLQQFEVRRSDEFEGAFSAMVTGHVDALVVGHRLEIDGRSWRTAHHDRPVKKSDAPKPPATMRPPAVNSASRSLTTAVVAAEISAALPMLHHGWR
jgi:hypothetical protein